jgi:hypothetical protein
LCHLRASFSPFKPVQTSSAEPTGLLPQLHAQTEHAEVSDQLIH